MIHVYKIRSFASFANTFESNAVQNIQNFSAVKYNKYNIQILMDEMEINFIQLLNMKKVSTFPDSLFLQKIYMHFIEACS